MAHRLPFSPNTPLPIATKVSAFGTGQVAPLLPGEEIPRFDPGTHLPAVPVPPSPIALAKGASIELLALDLVPVDPCDSAAGDVLWTSASFVDPLGRRIRLRGREAVPKGDARQYFGGVAVRAVQPASTARRDGSEPVPWVAVPLVAWGAYDIWVGEEQTDAGVVGLVQLIEGEEKSLDVILFPRKLGADGRAAAAPVYAAEELGAGGFRLTWGGVDYTQVPVVAVRAERGDTLSSIAKDMSVDLDSLVRANPQIPWPAAPLRGELLRVPYIVQAATAIARRVHSAALTWKEIIRGWTTLN